MEVRATPHPPAEVLRALALGKLDDATASSVFGHLEGCAECHRELAAATNDPFLNRLRQFHDRSRTPAPAKSLADAAKAAPSPQASIVPNLPPELVRHPEYEVLRELGRGGMGVVYLAKNKLLHRLEVLKVVGKALLEHPDAVERFLREIRSAARLKHPNVVTAYHALQIGGLLAFVMEYVEGTDLAKLVKAQGPLPVSHACAYAQQVAMGLQHAFEKGLVHRDIKPQNLILAREDGRHLVKILDFGLAKATREKSEDSSLTGQGAMLGTPDYIAPEQTEDAAAADIRADVYSLGCTLYHLLAGAPPFGGKSIFEILRAHHSSEARPLNEVRPEVPAELATVVRKMMAKDPAARYQTPAEVVQALNLFAPVAVSSGLLPDQTSPPAARRTMPQMQAPSLLVSKKGTGSGTTATRRGSRNKWLLGGVGVGGLLLALLGLWASGVFKVKVKTPDGEAFVVLEIDQPDAEVMVDGQKIAVQVPGDNQPISIQVEPGRSHKLRIRKDGFEVVSREVEIKSGRSAAIRVRLEPKEAPAPATKSARIPNRPKPVVGTTGLIPPAGQRSALTEYWYWKAENDSFIPTETGKWRSRIVFGDPSWKDYTFSFQVKKLDDAPFGVGVLVRASDLHSYYQFGYGGYANGEWSELVRILHGNWSRGHNPQELNALCRKIEPMKKGRWYTFEVTVARESILCRVEGIKMFAWMDDSLASGKVGLRGGPGLFVFRKIKVTAADGKVLWEGLPDLDPIRPSDEKAPAPKPE